MPLVEDFTVLDWALESQGITIGVPVGLLMVLMCLCDCTYSISCLVFKLKSGLGPRGYLFLNLGVPLADEEMLCVLF